MKEQKKTDCMIRMKHGFTLIEILVVVIVLGILAAIVIPQFTDASVQARENMVKENLRMIRTQVGAYKAQHDDVAPGYPNGDRTQTPTEADFVAQMTEMTDIGGDTTAGVTPYGPYLRAMPENPLNNLNTVEILNDGDPLPATGDNSHGWIFRPQDLTFRADSDAQDSKGTDFFKY